MTNDEDIGAVTDGSRRRKIARWRRIERGDVEAYLVAAAACSSDFERLAVRRGSREESRLIRAFALRLASFQPRRVASSGGSVLLGKVAVRLGKNGANSRDSLPGYVTGYVTEERRLTRTCVRFAMIAATPTLKSDRDGTGWPVVQEEGTAAGRCAFHSRC